MVLDLHSQLISPGDIEIAPDQGISNILCTSHTDCTDPSVTVLKSKDDQKIAVGYCYKQEYKSTGEKSNQGFCLKRDNLYFILF